MMMRAFTTLCLIFSDEALMDFLVLLCNQSFFISCKTQIAFSC